MQKKDNKVDNKTAYKEDRQRKKRERARDKYGSRFAKKVHNLKSTYLLVRMREKQKKLCN